ncbi:GreA/GreB family elongation factor [Pedobacter sp.]|jgi:regulator of nucleoside diphosphate kinase|uniref:GreA/GreB family elongation factor n=1 Tax=Pedobacter sp. TaxID=1411316 RepID=UPI002CDB9D9E|nr:GreA/GreB family elongation factor [Pedobacter sp.]HWW38503.1 GreA/GreB family elongation factor [Pedobacter sp.]
MENNQLIITKKEYELLSNHLKLSSRLSDFNKDKLHHELKSAKIVTKDNLPEDAIVLDSLVTIQDEETAQEFTFHLVIPEEANMKLNKLSVLAPIGIALLGYTSGARVDWEMPTGVRKFKVIKVNRYINENDKEIA